MEIETYFVNAFTNETFKGNPAGVCILSEAIADEKMQQIAAEINFSETAFIQHQEGNNYFIRYFTPTVEIDFCGHATLASTKVLLEKFNESSIRFTTSKNLNLSARQSGQEIEMKFPLYSTEIHQPNNELLQAIGVKHPLSVHFSAPLDLLIIEVESKEELEALQPNFTEAIHSSNRYKECVVTTQSKDDNYDFYSRCFCPWIGINEDPVTGAVHAALASYWSKKLGKTELKAFQLSERGGYLNLKIIDEETLLVSSSAVISLKGFFYL